MPKRPTSEYDALRTELISLHERAHEVWKWGLIAIVAILGFVLSLLTTAMDGTKGDTLLVQVLAKYLVAIALALELTAAGIAITVTKLGADVRDAMHRVGAYLAVFHEGAAGASSAQAESVGWHAWNRIEKAQPPMDLAGFAQTRWFQFHGAPQVYVIVYVFYAAVVVFLLGAIDKTHVWDLLWVSAVLMVMMWIVLAWIQHQSAKKATMWNARWAGLYREASEMNLTKWLSAVRLQDVQKAKNSE